MQTKTTAIIINNKHDVQTNNNYVQIIHDLDVEGCKRRRMTRMNLLRERKLGHHQWQKWKLNFITRRKLHNNEQQQKNTEQHRIARARMRLENFMKCENIKFKDADRHRKSRLLLSNEQLDYFRHKDAEQHRVARAHLIDEDRNKIRQKNAFKHLILRLARHCEVAFFNREVTRVLEYHRHECKQLGQCSAQCRYREIYDCVHNDEERQLIQQSSPGCRFRWKY